VNCFNHPDVPAVGICKYCQKGLCLECAVDLEHGIACRNHRVEVTALMNIHSGQPYNDERAVQKTVMLYRLFSRVFLCIGISMAIGGYFIGSIGGFVLIFAGIGFCVFSFIFSMDAKALGKDKSK
jgi:hypothetical protein